MSSPGQKTGTGFVGLSQYLNANAGNVQTDANAITKTAATAAQASEDKSLGVNTGTTPGQDFSQTAGFGDALAAQTQAQAGLDALKTQGGIANALQTQYGKTPGGYSATDNAFDAALQGQSQGSQDAFKAAGDKFGGLSNYLQGHLSTQQYVNAQNAANASAGTTDKPSVPVVKDEPPETYSGTDPTQNRGANRGGQIPYDGPKAGGGKSTYTDPLPPQNIPNPGQTDDDPNPGPKKNNTSSGL